MSLRGETGWLAANRKAFGKERWAGLHKSLKAVVKHVVLVNPFLSADGVARICEDNGLREHSSIPLVYEVADEDSGDGAANQAHVDDDDEGIRCPVVRDEQAENVMLPLYYLDGASVIAALALGVQPGDSVLDLCAAPGGKSVVLASLMFGRAPLSEAASGAAGTLVSNEVSRPRLTRLQRVLGSFLPPELMKAGGPVTVTNVDAATAGHTAAVSLGRLGPFDRVLVDAPCTSDRHLAHQGKTALAKWASGVCKSNAERQLDILLCAATLVKAGGTIMYCTCALAEQENDGVVNKFLRKTGDSFEVEPLLPPEADGGPESVCGSGVAKLLALADATAAGALMLPDRSGYGPMYMARLRRVG